ncbi:MAG: hypothetical protein ACJAXJ_000434 [Colwellia sp.]|jgi:hypothetical protein
MEKPNFVIGIGSQRAGSTLLHRILDECTDIFMHPVKELHYFDTLYDVRDKNVLTEYSKRQLNRELDRIIEAKRYGFMDKKYKTYLRANKILATKKVEDIEYIDLYRPSILGNSYLGEITPEYMILPDEGLQKMVGTVGKESKIILIARHPVQRFVSAFKLLKVYGGQTIVPEEFNDMLVDTLNSSPAWMSQQDELNDYQTVLKQYKQHFTNVLFLSYDNIVNDVEKTHRELEAFLNIPVDKQKYETMLTNKVNAIGETASVTKETVNVLAKRYTLQIAFLESYFGKSKCVL